LSITLSTSDPNQVSEPNHTVMSFTMQYYYYPKIHVDHAWVASTVLIL